MHLRSRKSLSSKGAGPVPCRPAKEDYSQDIKPSPAQQRWRSKALNLACCLLLLAGYAPSGYSAGLLAPDDAEVVSRGAQLYATHCASCHGKDLQGQADWRKRGKDQRLPAPPHDASGHTWHHSEALLFKMTKYGPSALVQGGYPSNMPGFEKILTDAEIIATLSYIKSTWPVEIRERHDAMR